MSNPIRFRRGTRNELLTITPAIGEPCWTSDTDDFYMGNGSTVGGLLIKSSPTLTDFSVYVATSALGATAGGSGRLVTGGTTDSTVTNKLADSTAEFTTAVHLNKSVYNATDDTWAKVTAVDSATQLSVSADIFVSGEDYEINDAVTTVALGINKVENPFFANVGIRCSPGTFTDDYEFVGVSAAGPFDITLQGSIVSTTTLSGEGTCRQRLNIRNITQTGRFFERAGCDITWTSVIFSGDDGFLFNTLPSTITNTFSTGNTVTFKTDPGVFTNAGSTINIGYTKYVAASALGGNDINDGLFITQGSATSTTTNKLVDSTANFNSADHLNKTVYNSTDNTWAKINTIDSTTQVALSVDIMASGESYVIVSAQLTRQNSIDTLPGTMNCNTTIKVSSGNFNAESLMQGKVFSGAFNLTIEGTLPAAAATGTASSGTDFVMGAAGLGAIRATLVDSGSSYTIGSILDSGNTDGIGASTSILNDTGQNFLTTVERGMIVSNTTDATWAYVERVVSDTQLAISADIMDDGEDYQLGWGEHTNKLLILDDGQEVIIDANTNDTLYIAGVWSTTPTTNNYSIYDLAFATTVDLSGLSGSEVGFELSNQKSVILKYFNVEEWHGDYAVYAHDFSQLSIFSCRFARSRTENTSDATIKTESYTSLSHFESSIIHETANTFLSRGLRLDQSAIAIFGDNIKNIKIIGCGEQVAINASLHLNTPVGHGWLLRNARRTAFTCSSQGRADMNMCIIIGAAQNGIQVAVFSQIIIRANNEISFCTLDGISCLEQGRVLSIAGSTAQVNYNGGWGCNTTILSYSSGVTSHSYTGNTSGTTTADATSVET